MSRADRAARRAAERTPNTTLDALLGFTPEPEAGFMTVTLARALPATLAAALTLGLAVAGMVAPSVTTTGATVKAAAKFYADLPVGLPAQPLPQRSVILAADGSRIAEFYSENRVLVPLSKVAPVAKDAVIAIEDSRFHTHQGLDFRGTVRAMLKTSTGSAREGGSTISQQYVKNVVLDAAENDDEKAAATAVSLERKLREAKLAISLENYLTKDQILEGYLNIAYFGDGAYGIGTAAQHYFGVSAAQLTLAQAAMIAGIVQNPTGYDPTKHPRAAKARRNVVLARMRDLGDITPAAGHQGPARPPGAAESRSRRTGAPPRSTRSTANGSGTHWPPIRCSARPPKPARTSCSAAA